MPRDRRSFAPAAVALAVGLLAAGPATGSVMPAPGGEALEIAAGMPLTEALLALEARGLELVFSSRLVRPEMRVVAAPVSDDPRTALDELLAPHGLAVAESPGGGLVVVAGGPPAPAVLRGSVRSRRALAAVPGVAVSAVGSGGGGGSAATTDAEGRFEIGGLAPGSYTVEVRRPGFVIERREGVALAPAAVAELSFVLQPAPLTEEEIAVHPSRISVLQERPAAPFALSRDQILALPHLGGDVFRALSLLPGTAGNDITAQFHLRGGRRDEVMVLLDGQELYEAYHLKDFDNALSVVPASGLASLDLTSGAFPSSYGDRMGGILDMASLAPIAPRHLRLAASVLDLQLEGSGTRGERLGWLASARRGTTDLAARVFGDEDPVYWDLFGKLDHRPTDRQSARLSLLVSGDRLDFLGRRNDELTRLDTSYDSAYLWLTHQAVLSDRLFVDSAVSASRIDRDRRGAEDEEEKFFDVRDRRDLDVLGALQSWNLQAGRRHFVEAGFEARRYEAGYDYRSFREFDSPFAGLRSEPREGSFAFAGRFTDDYLGAYVTDRFRPAAALTVELGARFDRHTLTGDTLASPRASLAWGLGGASVVRLGWGVYRQSQRAYELLVEDGDTAFYRAERSEQWVAGYEHLFGSGTSGVVSALRAEVYRRRVTDPRPRYESLFEPFEPFPEGELDRSRIAPESATADGFELFVRGRGGSRLDWWVDYGRAKTEETIGGVEVPRPIDQRHTVNANVNLRLGRRWDLDLAWRFHTGRPSTPVLLEEVEDDEGETEPVPVLGAIGSRRLPDYHRLDLRLSRVWTLRRGSLTLFFDAQNLYNRENVAGYDLELDEEAGVIRSLPETWPGFFASAGVAWEL